MDAMLGSGFVYQPPTTRVVFGSGTRASLADEVERLGISRALVLATPEQRDTAEDIVAALRRRAVGVFAAAAMHTPVAITDEALALVRKRDADGLVAIGGGSTIGLAKALVLRCGLPQIAVPTTYAGSEMTPILGQTQGNRKVTQRDESLRPRTVVYDVDLTLTLPASLSAASGFNAIAHAAEAFYAPDGNPIVSMMAQEGIAALANALPKIIHTPTDPVARHSALYGAWLCGHCLGTTGMGLHHKLCHILGGTFDLPHAQTHAVILPHAMAYNASAAPHAMARIARALDTCDAISGLNTLVRALALPLSLREIGMPERGIAAAADLAVRDAYPNPRALDRDALAAMLMRAWAGEPARTAAEMAA